MNAILSESRVIVGASRFSREYLRLCLCLPVLCSALALNVHASTEAVSSTSSISTTASGGSYNPALSSNNQLVAFVSYANNLVSNDDGGMSLDIFLRDLSQRTTQLISVNRFGLGGGNGDSGSPTLSDDGRYLAFESEAASLSVNDSNRVSDVFVRDVLTGVTSLASGTPGGGSANGRSYAPKLSGNGRWLVFESIASDLVANDTNGLADVFVRDVLTPSTSRVSEDSSAAGPGSGPAEFASIGSDGRYVAYVRRATNALEGVTSRSEIYIKDQEGGVTKWASEDIHHRAVLMNRPGYVCTDPTVSPDSPYVYFKVQYDGKSDAHLYRYDIVAGELAFAVTNVSPGSLLSVHSSGNYAAYESPAGIYVWDAAVRTNILVAATVANVQTCTFPSLARQASRVAYLRYDFSLGLTSVHAVNWETGSDVLVSVREDGTNAASATEIAAPVISADGDWIGYESNDPRIVSGDLNLLPDVFLRNLNDANTSLVSQRHDERPNSTWNIASIIAPQAISANGQSIAYQKYDLAPVASGVSLPPDNNKLFDVWVRNLETGTEQFAGMGALGTRDPVLSADGRYVAFIATTFELAFFNPTATVYRRDLQTGERIVIASNATYTTTFSSSALTPSIAMSGDGNLVAYMANSQVWVRDVAAGTNRLVSVNVGNGAPGGGLSKLISFRPDQRWILFQSEAPNLTELNQPGLFARDLLTERTRLLSSNFRLTRNPPMATFSPDSRFLVYVTAANNVEVLDLAGNATNQVCLNCSQPSIASGGRWVTFESNQGGGVNTQIYVKDLATGEVQLVTPSVRLPSGGSGRSSLPQISYDGRFVVFASRADDLVEGDDNKSSDVFVRDLLRNVTLLLSVNRSGTGAGDGSSVQPTLAADGRTVVFSSVASDLTEGDYNGTSDVFVARLSGVDSDGDGLDDDWEMAYFGTLTRDGTGDFDGDSVSDRNEFLAGTIPSSDTSVLQVLMVQPVAGSGVTVLWSATPGRTYQVEFKDTVDTAEWQRWPKTITSAGTTAALHLDSEVESHRFYRVVQVQ